MEKQEEVAPPPIEDTGDVDDLVCNSDLCVCVRARGFVCTGERVKEKLNGCTLLLAQCLNVSD